MRLSAAMVTALGLLAFGASHEADPTVEEALRIAIALQERLHGPTHAKVWDVWRLLALHLARIGREADAETAVKHAVSIAERQRRANKPLLAPSLALLGDLQRNAGHLDEAKRSYDEALARVSRKAADGAETERAALSWGWLAVYLQQKR